MDELKQQKIKKAIEVQKQLHATLTEEQKELIQTLIDNHIENMKEEYENYKKSGKAFDLHMATLELGGIGTLDTLLDNVNDANNKELSHLFTQISGDITGTYGEK